MQISGKEIYTGRDNIDACHTARKIKGQRVPALDYVEICLGLICPN